MVNDDFTDIQTVKKNERIKVLYVVDNLIISNGVSTVAMNYFRNINHNIFQVDFLVLGEIVQNADTYFKEIQDNGGNIFFGCVKYSIKNIFKIKKFIKEFFLNNKYDIVELHVPTLSYLVLRKSNFKNKNQVRIIHTHSSIKSSNKIKNLINSILNFNINKYGDYYFGCSIDSGKYWFGNKTVKNKKFHVIPNGTNVKRYAFNQEKREKLRKEFKIEENVVLGFVGRISKDKNLDFIIDVMKRINNKRVKLLLIGKECNDSEHIRMLIENQKNIKLVGFRKDISDLYNMLDYLVLCSKKEGLPMVVVEAQLNGLNCILSDTITKEVDMGLCNYVPLKKKKWIDRINNLKVLNIRDNKIKNKQYDITKNVKELEKIYREIVGR